MLAGLLLGALAAADVHSACVAVAEAGLSDPQVVAQQCPAQRPPRGFWLAQEAADCEQFSTMLRLASRLHSGVTAEAFCADVQDPDAGLLAAHAQCMRLWASAVDAPGVQSALQQACEAGHGPACTQFASALHSLPQEERRSLCDHTVTNGTGTWALDREHMQYSCQEFTLNCAATQACAPEAESRCTRAGFEADFCKPFATLVASVHSGDADAAAAEEFCKQHASSPAPTAVPAVMAAAPPALPVMAAAPPVAPTAAPASDAPTAAPVPDTEGSLTDCVEHTKQMLALGLGADELQHVAQEVCAKKYAAGICGNFTALVARAATSEESAKATTLHDACRVAISQNPFDMYSVCKQAVEKVESTDLEGDAFQKATFEVCTRLLEHEMQSVDAPITDGCTYFSGQLVSARARGPVKADTFCAQLTSNQEGTEDAPKPEPKPSLAELKPMVSVPKSAPLLAAPAAAPASPPAAPAPPAPKLPAPAAPAPVASTVAKPKMAKESLMEGSSRKVLLRKHSDAPPAETKASAEDEAFLNKFLDSYEANAGAPKTLQQRVDTAFPDAQPTPAAKASDVDGVISDFLTNYDQ